MLHILVCVYVNVYLFTYISLLLEIKGQVHLLILMELEKGIPQSSGAEEKDI